MNSSGSLTAKLLSSLVGAALLVGVLAAGITREVPYGGVGGTVVMQENGRPLPNATVILRADSHLDYNQIQSLPEEARPRSYVTETDENGRYRFHSVKAGDYEIEVNAQAHSIRPVKLVVAEGKPTELDIELIPSYPFLEVYAGQHVFRPGEPIKLQVHGFLPVDALEITVFRIDPSEVLKAGGLWQALTPFADSARHGGLPDTALNKVKELRPAITQRDIEGVFREFFPLGDLPEGLYWADCKVGNARRGVYLSVSRIAMVTKVAAGQLLAYVTEIDSGRPVSGARVSFVTKQSYQEAGITGQDGLARFPIKTQANQAMAMAVAGESQAFVDFYLGGSDGDGQTRVFTYTDRPVYRPGDKVRFKGVIRKLAGANYSLPTEKSVGIEVRDADETLVEKETLPLSDLGSFAGEFETNREASPGYYNLTVTCGGHKESAYVQVASYRKPEFEIRVTPEKPYYVRGERARMRIDAAYYFGSPVAGAEVSVSLYRAPRWTFIGDADIEEEWEEYEGEASYGGEWIEEIKATTGPDGRAVVEFGTSYGDPWDEELDSTYTAYVNVTDGDKFFSGEGSVKVVRGDVQLVAEADRWVSDVGAPVRITVKAQTQEGEQPAPGLSVKLTSGYEVWTGIESVFRPLEARSVRTGDDGLAVAEFTPNRTGSFVVTAECKDKHGNVIRSRAWIWVYGGATQEAMPPQGDLSVKIDKRTYNVGDSARVLIQTTRPGGAALITTEGEKVYSAIVVPLSQELNLIEVPITAEHRPNAFIGVSYIRDKKFFQRTKRFSIDLGEKKLSVQVSSDKASYRPGDVANYLVRTLDDKGNPVSAEVSLGVVDEAIYAIAKDRTDIAKGFYPRRYNEVNTGYSFEGIYLDGGDKGPQNIQMREKFEDTAAWIPFVRTDASGTARVNVKLPDNLTTWRATAVAFTADTAVGQGIHKVRAKKDVMVRVQTPAFFVQQDEQRVLVMVTNETGAETEINVELQATGLTLQGRPRRVVRVRNGATASVEWTASAPQPGKATLSARAWASSDASDGMIRTIDVQPHGRTLTDWESGEVRDETTVVAKVRPGADPSTGRLLISVSPSIASTVLQTLDELIGYPYGCVEQTMSRFLPTVVVSRTFTELGLPQPPVAAQIPEMVAEGFARLKMMQHGDGGWGWWEYDESDEAMTAMVLEGLHVAKQAGFAPDPRSVSRAIAWLEKRIENPLEVGHEWARRHARSSRLLAALALALHGRSEASLKALESVNASEGSAYDVALQALAYRALGPEHASEFAKAIALIRRQAKSDASGAFWPEQYWGVETTSRCLLALAVADPADPLLPKAVRHLMLERRGGGWWSTRDTALTVLALTEVWKGTKALELGGVLDVLVNGRPVRSVALTKEALFGPDLKIAVPLAELQPGENRITFRKQGPGICYFSTELRQTVVQERLPALVSGPGLALDRRFYTLSAQRLEDGSLRLMPSEAPVTQAERGQVLRCEITLTTNQPRQFVMVESPIPSNCHVTEREEPSGGDEWRWWFDRIVIRDDRVAFFARDLPAGVHRFTFAFRAENPGLAHALPAVAYNMYDPTVRSSTAENTLQVVVR